MLISADRGETWRHLCELGFAFSINDVDPLVEVFGAEKYARLQQIKTAWDPENLFRHNFNIKPLTTSAPPGV